jgi:hypothetical protein
MMRGMTIIQIYDGTERDSARLDGARPVEMGAS